MSQLENQLNQWTRLGLLTHDQARSILAYESKSKKSINWILTGFVSLGVVICVMGIISLIAANWDDIPASLKLTADFMILVGLASAAYRSWRKQEALILNVFLLALYLFTIASIGLISQVFQTGGQLYQALSIWTAITSGLAMVATHILVPLMWVGGLLLSFILASSQSPDLYKIFLGNQQAIFMCIPLLCGVMTIISRTLTRETPLTRAFRSWCLIGGIVSLIASEIHFRVPSHQIVPYLPGYALACLCVVGIWYSPQYRHNQKMLLLVTTGLYLLPFHFTLIPFESKVTSAACTIGVLLSMAMFLASLRKQRIFQLFLALAALRFLILYFQALGGLALTGWGLLGSGTIITLLTLGWSRYQATINRWAEEHAR